MSKNYFNNLNTAHNLSRCLAGANIESTSEGDTITLPKNVTILVKGPTVVLNYVENFDKPVSKDIDNFFDLVVEIKKLQLK